MAKTKKRIKKKVKIIGIVMLVLVLGTLSISALDYYIVYSEELTPVDRQKSTIIYRTLATSKKKVKQTIIIME